MSFKLASIIRDNIINIVHINTNIISGIPAIIAAKLTGKPCICHIRQTRKLIKSERFFAKWINQFIVINSDALELYRKDIPEEKLNLIYDGIDFEEFAITQTGFFRRELNLESQPTIGLIGRIVAGKGHKEFVLACEEIKKVKAEAKFIIVGDARGDSDVYYKEVKELVNKRNLDKNFVFTGWRNDVANIISDLDILVQASTIFPEGLPNVLIEAMVLSKPVIATRIPGSSDIVVDGETGFLVPPNDPQALADAIIKLINNTELAKRMGEAGRKRAEELFDIRKNVKQIEAIYEELLAKQA